ncbi:MAG: GtrA family protein [Rikenellaceae bacterium]
MQKVASIITRGIDFFYFPFLRKFLDIKTFRYAAVGGLNLGFGIVFYWFLYNFVLQKQDTDFFGLVTISAPVLAFLINFVVTFFSGFWLSRTIAFGDSTVRGRVQLARYLAVVVVNIAINYFGIKLLVEFFEFYPTPSYMLLQCLTVTISYLSSRYYTFSV